MAYTLKYYKTLSQPDGSNILLEIYEKDGTGASKEIGPVIQILRMDIQGSQNDIDTPIVKTSLTMTFVDAPDHEESSSKKCGNWEEFYTPDSTYWKVVLKSDSSSGSFRQIWGGYVTPDSFSEQLRYRGSVTIIARDNIGHLQDFPFDAEGNEDGMITVYDLVNAAWAKIGSPMSLDWRGEEDNALWLQCNGTDAPSAYMNVSAFEGKNWYEAVEDVLYSMGMVMRYVGNNTVQVSSLRYMQYQGKGDMSALPRIEPKFVAHAQRELAPAAKRIEESVRFELTDGKLAPLADGVLFTGLKGTSPFISENVFGEETIYDIPVWPIANIGDLGWSNVQSRTLFIDPSQYTLSGDMADDAKRMIFIAGNTGNSRAVSFGQRMACRDFRIELQFGRVAERMNNRLSYAWFVWPARFRGYLSVLQNGITQYYNGSGWQAAEYLIDEEIVEGMFAMDVPLSKFVGSAIVKLTIQEIVIGWKIGDVSDGQGLYVAVSSLKSAPIKSSLLETNRVNTNYDETNNVIIKRDPLLAPAYNEVPFPQVIKNGIFLIQDGAYVPAKEWAWPGGTPHQMAVYNHLQLLCYYAKPNNVITGDIINADLGDIRALYVWEGKEHLLQGGSLNFLNGRIEGAILREFTRYESLWGAMTRSVAMPEVEESSTTNLESGSSPASDSYDINTEVYLGGGGGTIVIDKAMSDTSQNAVENRVIKAYIDAGDNLIKEEIEWLKQQAGADTPSSFYHDMAAIVSHTGMITRQTREQLYNIFLFTEGNEVPSEPAWVIDTNGQHYIVRMLQTETGVGFFIIGYEGYTRIEGDNTKTNQLLRDKADKKYVDGTFFSQAQFDQIASNQYVVGNVAYQTDSDTGLRRLSLSLGLRIQNDIDAAVNDRPDDNGNYTNGLVTALGVKNWVENKGYLTSAAMGGYATKEEIANFISKSGGTVTGDLRIQGNITLLGEALFRAETPSGGTYPRFRMFQHTNGLFFQAASYDGTSVKGKIGFTGYGGSPAEDIQFIADSIRFVGTASFNGVQLGELAFKNTADIMAVGGTIGSNSNFNDYTTPGSYLVAGENMQNAPGGYGTLLVIRGIEDYFHSQLFVNANGTVKVRTESDGVKNWQPWRTLIDDANIATQLQNVGDSRYLKLTGGKITGSLEISADESIKASIPAGGTYSRYRFIQNNSALYFQVCKYDGIDRAGVLIISGISGIPAEKIQLNAQTLLFSGAATFQNSITLGNNTITSWDDFITSDGGTINAGKYLKFATSAYPVSLGVAATLDGYDKLVVSGLTQMSDLYITEKLYFEKGCTVTFRNWSTGEKETISSFSDLKGVLGLGGLAYKDEADVVKSASDFAASGNPNVIGYSYERNGWKGNGPAMLWGTDGYYTRLNVLTEDTDSPQMFISNVYANNAKGWAKVITDKNIGSYGLELIVASTHPEPTDRRAFATYAYQSYGWKTTGPALAFPDGTSKGLIQMGYDTDFVRMYIAGVKTEGVLSWTEVVTQETIGSMAMSIRSERLDASVDADDIINPGSYIVIGSTSFPVSHGVALTVAGTNTYFIGQLVLDGSGHIYSRLRWGEDWSDWNTVIDEGNIGDYALPKAGGTISGSLAVTGALAANGGIKLGDETINSWAEVRSNWGWRYTSLINQVGTIQIDIKIRQKTTIAETLTSAHRLVFNLITEANTNPEWLIVFTTGTTVPIIGIAKGSDSLYWQNNQNILNNLSPHTTYRIYIDSNLVMYDTFNVL